LHMGEDGLQFPGIDVDLRADVEVSGFVVDAFAVQPGRAHVTGPADALAQIE